MKIIVNSSELGMRRHWTNLVQVEDGDKAVRMVEDGQDWFQHHPAGTYLIETQLNQMGSIRTYHNISKETAEKLISVPIDRAVDAMERIMYS